MSLNKRMASLLKWTKIAPRGFTPYINFIRLHIGEILTRQYITDTALLLKFSYKYSKITHI